MNIHKVAVLMFVLMTGTLAYAVSQLTIPLKLTVTTAANVVSTPASLTLSITQGATLIQDFVLTNIGSGTAFSLACSTSGIPPEITVSYTGCSGNLAPAAFITVTATITASPTAAPGPYSAQIIVTWT